MYRFRDPHGRVIYVGKAKSLRSRLTSYFADVASLAPRTRQMVMTAGSVEWTVVTTEVEALQLEYNWIKEFDPRFNIRYRDDKTYPVLAVTLNEEYPRLMVYRGPRRKGVRYFGPYSHAWAIRETLDLLTRVFPARTCSAGVFKRHRQIDRPCLLGYIDKCSAPCIGRVSAEEHRRIVLDFCDFLSGKTDRLARDLEQQMTAAAEELDFERAARLRDDIGALKRALEKQAVVLGDERLITRAVGNAIANARLHNEGGCNVAVRLAVREGAQAPEAGRGTTGGFAAIRVADDGAGASPEELAALEARLARARTSRSAAGSYGEEHGLGLVLVDRIARAHGGSLVLKGEPGRGFAVEVLLPLA